jgi:sulfite exporter TauE/SafE
VPLWPELAPFVLLGLVGSLHCTGMCGGFALAVTASAGAARRRALLRSLAHVLGKALTYAVLGLLAARAAGFLTHEGATLAGGSADDHAATVELARRVLAWIAGALFIVFGLAAFGLPLFPRGWLAARVPAWLRLVFDSARALPGLSGAFGLGLANGLLPCGLSWAALALAAGGPPARGALGLFVFGLATAPALVTIGLLGSAVPVATRARALRFVAAPLLLVFGVLTIARGGALTAEVLPACCAPEAGGESSD